MAATAAAHDPVPDDSVRPTPRSQMRMRTRSRATTSASSKLTASGNAGWRLQRAPESREALLLERAQHDALRIAHPQADGVHVLPRHREPDPCDVLRSAHVGAKRVARRTIRLEQMKDLGSRVGVNRERLSPVRRPVPAACARQQGPERPHAVARHFRRAAIGVDQPHAGAVRGLGVDHEAIRPDAHVTLAEPDREAHRVDPRLLEGRRAHVEEVVSVRVSLGERDHRQNARPLSSRTVTGPSFSSRTSMWAWNTPVSTGKPSRPQLLDHVVAQGAGEARRRRGVERRPPSLSCVRIQRELRHHEHGATRLGDRPVHLAVRIVEHAEVLHLAGHVPHILRAIVAPDADEHQQAATNGPDHLAIHLHRGRADALDDRSHVTLLGGGTTVAELRGSRRRGAGDSRPRCPGPSASSS